MKKHFINLIVIVFLLGLTLQACGSATPVPTQAPAPAQIPTDTVVIQPTNTQPAPSVELPTNNTATPPPVPTATPQPTAIQHVTRPGDPSYISTQLTNDCVLGTTTGATPTIAILPTCDNPSINFIERPVVSSSDYTYLPYLDIVRTQLGGTIIWIFARINVDDAVTPTGTGDVYYFFKLDLNLDGRNSNILLISVKNLPLNTILWTVDGVQVWANGSGQLAKVFDSGVGTDPDLAWARRSPNSIEIAFKQAYFNGPSRFAWSAWTYQGTLTPPDLALSNQPLDLYQIDNTCAWGFNVSAYGLINHCFR